MLIVSLLSWAAVVILMAGYWLQIWKIHIHREVRDISMPYYVMLALGFGILMITAYLEDSTIFLVKQVGTFVPCAVIIFQVWHHRKDRWHDPRLPHCSNCDQELDERWHHCPFCGQEWLTNAEN